MRTILVVANQTLGGDDLLTAVREKLEGGPAHLHVVVPATPLPSSTGGPPPADGDGWAQAERRLEQGLERLRGLGVAVTGEVGDPDPMQAVTDALAHREVDEVVVSTLPSTVSRWLHTDLPSRVQRKHHLPVTTVTARPLR